MKTRQFLVFSILTLSLLLTGAGVQKQVPLRVQPFPLDQVRLLDSPFKSAMDLDAQYLLGLQPDRLLSWYRKEAGLEPKAPVYGGWESTGLAGHTLGHYLSACSLMYQSSGDRRFQERVEYIVGELAECQQANGNGYIAAMPGGKDVFGKIARGQIDAQAFGLNGGWSPWYTIHKELAGLIDSYTLCGDTQALTVATNFANWVDATTANLTDAQWQKMLKCEYGGMNEALANLSALTGNERYLELAKKFYDLRVLSPLARGEDDLTGKHSNTQIPKIIGLARLYELTGDRHYADTATFFWQDVALHRSYVIGGNGDGEHFFDPNDFSDHLSAATAETCCTYNMLKLTRHLFEWSPNAALMDFYEEALYNDILASQDPRHGNFVYLMSLKPGHFKTFSTTDSAFWCCVGTGMENHAKYGDTIYFHNDNSLFLNLFIPSELSWAEKNVVVKQTTKFPEENTTHLEFKCARPARFALNVRWPSWSDQLLVQVNGKKKRIAGNPGSYVTIDRRWHDGDSVTIALSMKLRTEPLPGASNIVALLYGPIVLAGELGTDGMPNQYAEDQTALLKTPDPAVPVFVGYVQSLTSHIKPAGPPLTFRTSGIGRPQDVTLIPFYKLNYERYSIYWNVISQESWESNPAKAQAEAIREMETAMNGGHPDESFNN